jgi:3-dehydroquinate synthase
MLMKPMVLHGLNSHCPIFLDASLERLSTLLAGRRVLAISDENVAARHGQRLPKDVPLIILKAGEKQKNLATVTRIYGQLLKQKADRQTFILGVGGGVVCDISGYVASTFMRGLDFGLVPTTLLAQTDAAIGGKNGVNFCGYKNIIGLIRQPDFVLCDYSFLATLPKKEILCGLAEIIKHAAIASVDLFKLLETQSKKISQLHPATMAKVMALSLPIKIAIVEGDERENGERKKLNFGHTLGHALEKVVTISHGEAVSVGMCFAGMLSQRYAGFKASEHERLLSLLRALHLPLQVPADKKKLKAAIGHDKKRHAGAIDFVMLERIGKARIISLPVAVLKEAIDDLC